jgi:hypothetical protein
VKEGRVCHLKAYPAISSEIRRRKADTRNVFHTLTLVTLVSIRYALKHQFSLFSFGLLSKARRLEAVSGGHGETFY